MRRDWAGKVRKTLNELSELTETFDILTLRLFQSGSMIYTLYHLFRHH
jgi:hypothetical protein